MKKIGLLSVLFLLILSPGFSQENSSDTLKLTLQETEKLFISNNLLLLASKYNIEAARAQTIQSRLWENPSMYLEQNIYNKYTGKSFDVSQTGQSIVHVQQLLLLAGKRNKRIALSEINTEISEYQFYDLMRSLKHELRSAFFDTYYLIQTIKMYEDEVQSLKRTLEIFDILVKKSAISMKEVIRVKALLFTLETERLEIINRVYENQAVLHTLLNKNQPQFIFPVLNDRIIDSLEVRLPALPTLQDTALARRMDLKIYERDIKLQEANISYQKALVAPDIRLGYMYDRAGSYIPNYNAVTLQIDLPLSNRNQGNIAIARHKKEESIALMSNYRQQLLAEVNEAYRKVSETNRIYITLDKNVSSDFDDLVDIIMKNYEKRNISLIEFLDYYQAYKTSMLQIIKLKNDRMQALERLNYYTGKNILEF